MTALITLHDSHPVVGDESIVIVIHTTDTARDLFGKFTDLVALLVRLGVLAGEEAENACRLPEEKAAVLVNVLDWAEVARMVHFYS